jgi:hypothetical protein
MEEIKYPDVSYPTKNDIMQILKEENPPVDESKRYNQLFLIIEFKKISEKIGIIKGELYGNGQLEYRGSILIPLLRVVVDQQSIWNSIEAGKSIFYGISFDTRELGLTEKVSDFFGRSIEEGKIQDFIPFLGFR